MTHKSINETGTWSLLTKEYGNFSKNIVWDPTRHSDISNSWYMEPLYIDSLVQDCNISVANTLGILQCVSSGDTAVLHKATDIENTVYIDLEMDACVLVFDPC